MSGRRINPSSPGRNKVLGRGDGGLRTGQGLLQGCLGPQGLLLLVADACQQLIELAVGRLHGSHHGERIRFSPAFCMRTSLSTPSAAWTVGA